MEITLQDARKRITKNEIWLWRQENWVPGPYGGDPDGDYFIEAMFWEIPNMA